MLTHIVVGYQYTHIIEESLGAYTHGLARLNIPIDVKEGEYRVIVRLMQRANVSVPKEIEELKIEPFRVLRGVINKIALPGGCYDIYFHLSEGANESFSLSCYSWNLTNSSVNEINVSKGANWVSINGYKFESEHNMTFEVDEIYDSYSFCIDKVLIVKSRSENVASLSVSVYENGKEQKHFPYSISVYSNETRMKWIEAGSISLSRGKHILSLSPNWVDEYYIDKIVLCPEWKWKGTKEFWLGRLNESKYFVIENEARCKVGNITLPVDCGIVKINNRVGDVATNFYVEKMNTNLKSSDARGSEEKNEFFEYKFSLEKGNIAGIECNLKLNSGVNSDINIEIMGGGGGEPVRLLDHAKNVKSSIFSAVYSLNLREVRIRISSNSQTSIENIEIKLHVSGYTCAYNDFSYTNRIEKLTEYVIENYDKKILFLDLKYMKMSETEYKVNVDNEGGKYFLVFRNSYSKWWQCNGKKAFCADFYANCFVLDDVEFVVSYAPKDVYRSSLAVSIITVSILFSLALYQIAESAWYKISAWNWDRIAIRLGIAKFLKKKVKKR
ncbi:MAG: hypothetical protein QXT63_02300 [Thermoplasmata archaeon]